jgi:acetyl-CoA C-acetyltransferase
MSSRGICDRVAIVGMGCTPFGEHWDKSADDLLIDAAYDASQNAGIGVRDVDAFWLGTYMSGVAGLSLSRPLRLTGKPVTHVENMCATGSEALRAACYAVACGAYDTAMAVGVEKLKDSGFSGLTRHSIPGDGIGGTLGTTTAPANFSLLGPAYSEKYGVAREQLKEVCTRIAWKNHRNGAVNPRAQFRRRCRWRPSLTRRWWPGILASSTAPGSPTARRRPSSCAPRTPTATPTGRST